MCRMACHIQNILALLLLIVICSQEKVPCNNLPKLIKTIREFQAYCGCNGWELPYPDDISYLCNWEFIPQSGFENFERPILILSDFKFHNEQWVTCTSSRSKDAQLQNTYILKMDNEQSVSCAESLGASGFMQIVQCNIALKTSTWKNIEHILMIPMTDSVIKERVDSNMRREKRIPRRWPIINEKMFIDHICLDMGPSQELIEILQINVLFIPLNPRIPQLDFIHEGSSNSENEWFNIKLYPYQNYNVRLLAILKQGFIFIPANYDAGNATSEAEAPSCPPKMLTNGFFYDPGKRQLHIFWLPLDELDVNGPELWYSVYTDTGSPQTTRHNSVIFTDWNPTQSATVTIWSENSEGRSANSSQLEIPTLTNSWERQPQNVRYHVSNFTITWRPPKQQVQLIGYTVFWCSPSRNRTLICDETDPSHVKSLDQSQHQLQFNYLGMGTIIAVACLYKDKPSGGLTWIDTTVMPFTSTNFFVPFLALVLVVPVAFGLIFILIRRIRVMSKIEVVLPEFMTNSKQISSDNFEKAAHVAVPGNWCPKVVLNQALSSMEEGVQLNLKTGNSRTSLECQDSKFYKTSSTENVTAKEESSSLKGLDVPKDLEIEKVIISYVTLPKSPQESSDVVNEQSGNYSSNVMVNQKLQRKSSFERKPEEEPISCKAKGSERLETSYSKITTTNPCSSAVNEKNKDPCPYKRVP